MTEETPAEAHVFEIKRFEDVKGRTIDCRYAVDRFTEFESITDKTPLNYQGQCVIQAGQHSMQMHFRIEANSIFEAFDKFDATAKVQFKKKMKEIESEQRKAAIIKGASIPMFPPKQNGR